MEQARDPRPTGPRMPTTSTSGSTASKPPAPTGPDAHDPEKWVHSIPIKPPAPTGPRMPTTSKTRVHSVQTPRIQPSSATGPGCPRPRNVLRGTDGGGGVTVRRGVSRRGTIEGQNPEESTPE